MLGQPASEGLLVSSREPPLRFSAPLQLILLRVFAPDERMRCRSGHTCPSFPLGISPPVTHMQEYSTHSAGKESVGSLALILSLQICPPMGSYTHSIVEVRFSRFSGDPKYSG